MKIGPYSCMALVSNRLKLDGGAMFGVVPKTLWSRFYPADDMNRISMVTRLLLLVGDGRVILVDSGTGDRWDPKFRDIYGIEEQYSIEAELAEYGLTAADVTHVIHSHLHFDHCGGSVVDRDGEAVPRFPNAEYWVHEKQLDWAKRPSARDRASFRPEDFIPLLEAGQLRTVTEKDRLPGLELLPAGGHTPWQILPRVYDETRSLLYCGDMIPLAEQIRVPWIMAYDLFPLQTLEEKSRILTQASEERWILFFEHDAHTEAMRVRKGEKGFESDHRFKLSEMD